MELFKEGGLLNLNFCPLCNISWRFIAMCAFVYGWDFLRFFTGVQTNNLRMLKAAAGKVCNLTYL